MIDCSRVIQASSSLGAYQLTPLHIKSIARQPDSSVNCDRISFCPHNACTHTENLRHIYNFSRCGTAPRFLCELAPYFDARCDVIWPKPCALKSTGEGYQGKNEVDDRVISLAEIARALKAFDSKPKVREEGSVCRAIMILLEEDALAKDYSGTNPVYFTDVAMNWIAQHYQHVLYSGPSIDREDDGGMTPNHRTFLHNDMQTISELVFPNPKASAGLYRLHLQLMNLRSDAVPSRPFLTSLA